MTVGAPHFRRHQQAKAPFSLPRRREGVFHRLGLALQQRLPAAQIGNLLRRAGADKGFDIFALLKQRVERTHASLQWKRTVRYDKRIRLPTHLRCQRNALFLYG